MASQTQASLLEDNALTRDPLGASSMASHEGGARSIGGSGTIDSQSRVLAESLRFGCLRQG